MNKTVVKLDHPFTSEGHEYKEISIRRPKVRDQLNSGKSSESDEEKEISLIVNLAEIPKEAIEEMDLADYGKIQKVLMGFLSPKTA